MIKQLRKRHLQIWSLLLLLIPAGIIAAWVSIPKQPVNILLQPVATDALPINLKTIDKPNYKVSLKTNNERTALQLEWINKSTLTSPSALIYKISEFATKDITENDLIGRIDVRGIFHFNLKNDTSLTRKFILYDIIHHQSIDTINFNQ